MHNLAGQVAVVTGAASGIGEAVVHRLVAEGMKVVLADIESGPLARLEADLRERGADVFAVRTDVADDGQVARLADETLARFGAVHLVCNSAGVSVGGAIWEHDLSDWRWVLSINLGGVIHTSRHFVPQLIAQGAPGHIVNVASISGLICSGLLGVYNVSKHAVVAYSETLFHDLQMRSLPIGVSVVCPGWVATRIMDAARNRPEAQSEPAAHPEFDALEPTLRAVIDRGMAPAVVAERIVAAVRADEFWVLTHDRSADWIRMRYEEMLEGRKPTPPPVGPVSRLGS